MPYNLKHLVHMPNTKQAEIHNSLASALFALLNNIFLQYPVDRCSISALYSENEEHAEVFEQSEAVPSVSSLWALWCPYKSSGLHHSAWEQQQPSLQKPAFTCLSTRVSLSECWYYCSTSTHALCCHLETTKCSKWKSAFMTGSLSSHSS